MSKCDNFGDLKICTFRSTLLSLLFRSTLRPRLGALRYKEFSIFAHAPLSIYWRNRLSPRYINIATTRYNFEITAGANNTNTPKRKERERRRENNANIGGSTKTIVTRNRCVLSGQFPPQTYHSESPRTKQHLQEGNNDAAAVARTSPRVSPGTLQVVGKR